LEHEADHVADQVMRTPAPDLPIASTSQLSHECADCETEEGTQTLQAKRAATPEPAAEDAPGVVHEVLRSPGQPLDATTRAYFEPRFGHELSAVRVHSGAAAEQSARAVNAHAYTVGRNIVFGAGRLAPGTQEGRLLLAHELTHVVQQSGASRSTVQRQADPKQQQADLYVAPNSGGPAWADSTVQFAIKFVDNGGSPVAKGEKGMEIRTSGDQLAWLRSFQAPFFRTPPPEEEKIVSARLWNDATFDYSVTAGIRFNSTLQGDRPRQFFSNALKFEMPRRGTIRLRSKLEEKQHWVWMTPSPTAGRLALGRFQALYPTLGINDAMRTDVVIGRDSGRVLFAFFYFTGAMKLESGSS